jgi:hypothetical protein
LWAETRSGSPLRLRAFRGSFFIEWVPDDQAIIKPFR